MPGNLIHALYATRDGASEAFRFAGEPATTVAEARAAIGRIACALLQSGVARGDRVSFKLEKSKEVLFLAHAVLQIGAILHPLNTAYTDSELAYLVGNADPSVLVCHPDEAGRLAALCSVPVLSLAPGMTGTLGEQAARAEPVFEIADVPGDHVAALLYTSGTTGRPKGACITHRNLVESATELARVWRLSPADRLLHVLPMYHAHGLLTSINSMMIAGASVVFLPRFDVPAALDALPECTVFMGVPTLYARLLKEERLAASCKSLKLAISGSAPLPREIGDAFQGVTGLPVLERYGSTETAIVTAVPAGAGDRAGYVGWALPGVEIRVVCEDGSRAATGASGSLETRGHNIFAGYWRDAEANARSFTDDGWFITGDIGAIDETGCLQLLGRSKDIIITGGLNVYPKEVEDALSSLLAGREVSVFGVPHPDFGEGVVAAVEDGGVIDSAREAELIQALRVSLAAYKVPKRILSIPAIPKNVMGKVLKTELRDAHRTLFHTET